MKSIFDLKTSEAELKSANEGISRMEYDEQNAQREITGVNFPSGKIHYRWNVSGTTWWVPSKSYMRFRVQLGKEDGTILLGGDNIAPGMNMISTLFQSVEMRLNGKPLDKLGDFAPQVDTLQQRLSKSRSWLKSLGTSLNFWDADFLTRQSAVIGDGFLAYEIVDPTNAPSASTRGRVQLGFDAPDGAGNNRNVASYVDATGLITFAQNGGGALPADVRPLFPIGSYFMYTFIQGGGGIGDFRVNKAVRVISHTSATVIGVAPLSIGGDVVVDGRTVFVSILPSVNRGIDEARKLREFEVLWRPPVEPFVSVDHALPVGDYELILTPQTAQSYQKYAIESLVADKVPNLAQAGAPTAGSNFLFNVQNAFLYISRVEGARVDDLVYMIDMETTTAQSKSVDGSAFQQKPFDISPSTYALTVAFQDNRAGSDSRISPTRFVGYNDPPTATGLELALNRLYISYAGQQLPAPEADPSFAPEIDRTVQRYAESQIYSSAYDDTGGAESLHEWQTRGAYYHFVWPRDGADRSTRAVVNCAFNSAIPDADLRRMRVMLFAHARKVARITIAGGRVVDVQVVDA